MNLHYLFCKKPLDNTELIPIELFVDLLDCILFVYSDN